MYVVLKKIVSFTTMCVIAMSLAFQPVLDAAAFELVDCETNLEEHIEHCHSNDYELSHHGTDNDDLNSSDHSIEHAHHVHFSHTCSNIYFLEPFSTFNNIRSVQFKPLVFEPLLHPVLNPNTLYRPPRALS